MIPVDKVREIVSKHKLLERELSSNTVEKNKFAQKSKEYADLNEIIEIANLYKNFEKNKNDLENIINETKSETEMKDLAKLELSNLINENKNHEKKLKIFLFFLNSVFSRSIKSPLVGLFFFSSTKT